MVAFCLLLVSQVHFLVVFTRLLPTNSKRGSFKVIVEARGLIMAGEIQR